ncbi:hypothetical protein GMOD_00005415 [Pyrenophora seminiperda CCB06]|uniref:Uncharacterized protein n=1 Tax=Pyrenophora seminiperda CCB06 TaxID=1302712 RepID=A0A3M7LVR4_9PLEO|nr:hypothetical protein GMOD_00005415 [Pyrenophora seminiperda CCB06]
MCMLRRRSLRKRRS